MTNYSIILPARNEAESLKTLLPELKKHHPYAEIIVVNDGSTDNTLFICEENDVNVITHPYSIGNGGAIKTGARNATGDILVFMDADGQHRPEDINRFLHKMDEGYDLVVGARDSASQASLARKFANALYNKLASYVTNSKVEDLTSGFRAARATKFREFISLLPNGFSYPTTSTMAFFRAGYPVAYIPIKAHKRIGKSHINMMKDGVRFLLIIFKVGTLYSPLKIFVPFSFFTFALGLSYYLYTFISYGQFTNMSALMFTTSMLMFFMGLISEQITALMYKESVFPVPKEPATPKEVSILEKETKA
jgi:glycosyltransferase involved in cell wall biosynthesis